MISEQRKPNWQKIKQLLMLIGILIGVIVLLFILIQIILVGYRFDWTGFNVYTGPQLRPNQQYRPGKTLWDWLQLLIIPIVLAAGGFWFNRVQKSREEKTTVERTIVEKDLSRDQQRESALQVYIDNMPTLIRECLDEV